MRSLCCGRPLHEVLKFCAVLDLFLDNLQVAVRFICFAFPSWLPKEYFMYKVPTLQPSYDNMTAPSVYRPHEDPYNVPPKGETDFILFLGAIGLVASLCCTSSLFYWLWTGAKQINLLNCKKWLCVRIIFLTVLLVVTIYKLASQNYYAFDIVLDALKIYSIYEIFIVKSFIDLYNGEMPVLMKPRGEV